MNDSRLDFPPVRLCLFVAGRTMKSLRAIQNLRTLQADFLGDHARVEVVDLLTDPARARQEQIVATPTLVRLEPPPVVRIIGDLADRALVLSTLGLSEEVVSRR